ncbi:MAG: hypothetical protein Faunusvirus7_28 [Faunusvirus sp.]|jgi:hypothetical protein|uniref:Transmembrane protein n=1 Tax=Faunusvirus sp. TaxID=2487766 RepID=A0A3G4ZWQ8_9VIRU|nr:MAG: hypothetical protein Faunusvirus7_28 [Faunusvirus sp.]
MIGQYDILNDAASMKHKRNVKIMHRMTLVLFGAMFACFIVFSSYYMTWQDAVAHNRLVRDVDTTIADYNVTDYHGYFTGSIVLTYGILLPETTTAAQAVEINNATGATVATGAKHIVFCNIKVVTAPTYDEVIIFLCDNYPIGDPFIAEYNFEDKICIDPLTMPTLFKNTNKAEIVASVFGAFAVATALTGVLFTCIVYVMLE